VLREREVTVTVAATWRNLFGLRGPKERTEADAESTLIARIDVGNEYIPTNLPDSARRTDRAEYRRTDRLYFVITVSSGVFVKLCSDKLDTLRTRFEKHNGIAGYEVVYDYVVE
jgi:hypothetical protein